MIWPLSAYPVPSSVRIESSQDLRMSRDQVHLWMLYYPQYIGHISKIQDGFLQLI